MDHLQWDWQQTLQSKIKEILDKYPDDGQILKEIIQNAEDGKAKCVKFLYDKNSYSIDGLQDPSLAQHQGEALYAYNDAVFTDEDFRNLLNVGKSYKQADRTKVGRFGQGFKSIFHMTELPTLLSGKYIAKISPYKEKLPCGEHSRVYSEFPAELQSFQGEFQGYNEGVDENGLYKGTMFRFPLRKHESEISKTLYGEEKIVDLFNSLKDRAYMNLLFLKSLESIEVYVRELHEPTPRLQFRICLINRDEDVLNRRAKFFQELGMAENKLVEDQRHLTYQIDLQTYIPWPAGDAGCADDTRSFLVCHYYDAKGVSSRMKELLVDERLSYLPLVGVAMPLGVKHAQGISEPDGHIFCFLPLPIHDNKSPTGLPVHINSFFVVGSDRSEVKWPTAGQSHEKMSNNLKWNQCLLEELIPCAYTQLLLDATQHPHIQPDDICHAFPNTECVDEKLKGSLVPPFLKQVLTSPILPTAGGVNRYVGVKDAVLCSPQIDEKTRLVLVRLLTECQMNAVCIPAHMMDAIKSTCIELVKEATPTLVCQVMKQFDGYMSYSRQGKLELLQYLLGKGAVRPQDLHGLQLLPCSDGTFTVIGSFAVTEKIYIATDKNQKILPSLESKFLSNDIDQSLKVMLCQQDVIGNTQLVQCTEDDILTLLPQIFPQGCKDKDVLVCDNDAKHLTNTWLDDLWHFLVSVSESHPNHLNKVKHLHILPIPNTAGQLHLSKLSGGATCVVKQLHDECLPYHLAAALEHFKITLLDRLPEVIMRHPHVFDQHCVYQPNPESVMLALLAACSRDRSSNVGNFNNHASREERLAFLQFFEPLRSELKGGSEWKSFMKQLALFETVDGSGNQPRHYTSVNEVQNGMRSYSIPVHCPCQLLDISSLDVQLMSEYIGIKTLTETMVLEEHLFDEITQRRIGGSDVEKVMVYVLQDLDQHVKYSSTFKDRLIQLAFLTDKQGTYHRALDCFDPSDSVLQNFFQGEDRFPTEIYCAYIDQLRRLGLKGRSMVVDQDVLISAQIVDRDSRGLGGGMPLAQLETKSRGIADVIESGIILRDAVRQQLRNLSWVPVQQERPAYLSLLPWGAGSGVFQSPNSLCLSSQIPVVGSTMPSTRISVVPDKILETICGHDQCSLPVAKIVQHLKNIVTLYKPEEKLALMGFVKQIYDTLRNYGAPAVRTAFSAEGLTEWVWHGNGFTSVECVSKDLPENMEPYAYRIPDEMSNIHPWLLTMGARVECNWPQILLRIKKWYDAQDSVSKERVSHDLEMVKQALKRITDLYPSGVPANVMETVVLPVGNSDGKLQLLPASECTYCGDDWAFGDIIDVQDDGIGSGKAVYYIDDSISKELAEAFGVKTSLNRLLEDDSEGIPVVEGHGQEESLTQRLRLLLQDYPDGLAIPKELIQNADDAGACEVKFLYDERENLDAMDGLLGEGMKECQGPALWVYNDKMFSATDLKNIKKLSGATKEAEGDKIGKFGLGFNVVYNVTDVPSFMTNETIVIFDPHKSHLGRAKAKDDAGLKINIFSGSRKSAQIRKKFYNQFKTYHGVFGCQVAKEGAQCPFSGTLFRLPLRQAGSRSEINSMPYTKDSIEELFQLIIDQASDLLLFTQSVKSIELHHLAKTAKDPSQSVRIFHVKSTPNVLRPLPCLQHLKEEPTILKTASCLVKDLSKALPSDMCRTSIVHTCQQLDARCQLKLRGQTNEVHWLVHDCVGTKESMTLARSSTLQSNVPVAGIAVQLEKKDQRFKPVTSSGASLPVFCHLPLPSSVRSGLPVIVNGSFAIKPDRRQIVKITSDDKVDNKMSAWNEALKRDVITEAYIGALTQIKDIVTEDYEPYSLWPDISSIDEGFKSVYTSFFQMLASQTCPTSPKIFTNGSSWFDYQHAVFLDEILASSDLQEVFLCRLQFYLERTPSQDRITATILPNNLKEGFSKFNINAKVFTCAEVYVKAILPYLHQLDNQEQTRLLLFALQQAKSDQTLSNILKAYPCIPVQPNGKTFLKPDQLISPNGRRANLFNETDGVFPMPGFCGDESLSVLKDLGMNVNDISWDLVTERAESMRNLSGRQREERMQHWTSYVEEKLQCYGGEKPSQVHLEKLKTIRFLPVLPKPEHYPIRWKGDDMTGGLVSADDAFATDCKNLVGSIRYIVDEKICGLRGARPKAKLIEILGLQERFLSLDDFIIQLKMLATVQPNGSNSSKVKEICNDVYSKLDERCGNSTDAAMVQNELKELPCLYTGDKFMHPKYCAKSGKLVSNFLHVLPYPLTYRPALLQALGVKEQFHATDYIDALQRIAPDTGVRTVREIAENLCDCLSQTKTTLQELNLKPEKGVQLPSEVNDRGVWKLLPVKELCLNALGNDHEKLTHKQWLGQSVGKQKLHYVHPDIPLTVAKALGVKSDRENVLSKLGSGMPFGQSEPLSRRIRNILNNYPSDEGVLEELLQNADDAGATELRFVLDRRNHPDEKVFNDNWKQLQGPALCVFNNKPFTKKDLKGICSLGQGAKSSDPAKTGQYGIGFNSVYHLTDVPSFLTDGDEIGKTFGVLDPNLTFAPGVCVESPGQLYQSDHFRTVRDDFADVFSGYLENKFDLKGGTLFRLPLRSEEMAEKSEISKKHVEVDDAARLLRSFEAEVFQSLLFVNSVRSITLESIGDAPWSYMYSVTVTISNQDQAALSDFNQYVKSVGERLTDGSKSLRDVQYREVVYTLSMEDSKGKSQNWVVCQCIGFKQSDIPAEVLQAVASKDLALLPRGGAAILLSSTEEVKGRNLFCFLPLPSRGDTQLPVHVNGHFVLDSARRALWDDDANFKGQWNTLIMEKIVAQAYVSLISDQCAKLKDGGATVNDLKKLFKMFPDRSKVKKHYLLELVDNFYRALHERKIECLAVQVVSGGYVETRWFNIAHCVQGEAFFDNLSPSSVIRHFTKCQPTTYRGPRWTGTQQTETVTVGERDEVHSLTNILCRLGFSLLCSPMFIYDSLQKVEIGVRKVEPITVLDYLYNYKAYTDCTLKGLPQPVCQSPYEDIESVVTVIKYCYKSSNASNENIKSLQGLPLCVTGDGLLKEFSVTTALFYPRFDTLAPDHASRFVNRDVFVAIPSDVRTKEPLALVELTIQDLTPLLLPGKEHLKVANRIEWNPTTDTDKTVKKWIEELWELINSEINEACRKKNGDREALHRLKLAPLKPFCIVPAHDRQERKHFLYQLECAKCVMSESVSVATLYKDDNVRDKLLEAGIPKLDKDHLPGRTYPYKSLLALPKELTSNMEDPRSVLYALWCRLQNKSDVSRLKQVTENTRNAHMLREYFTAFFKNQCTNEEAVRLRDLPIYEFVNVTVSVLNKSGQGCYLVPTGIPKAGLDNWYSKDTHEKFIFQTATDVDKLLCRLGAVKKSEVDLYVTLILTEFNFQHFLSEDEQRKHLDFIRTTVIRNLNSDGNEYKALLASLQKLPFLKNSNGDLQLAKEFFSPNVPLFKAMEIKFPPKEFCDIECLAFLQLCGLRATVTAEDLVRYAGVVEQEGKTNPKEITKMRSRLICEELRNQEETTLFQLKDIAFVPIESVPVKFSNLHCQFCQEDPEKMVFTCFQNSVMYSSFEVCWTSAKILPAWMGAEFVKDGPLTAQKLQQSLGIQSKVTMTTVLAHCIKLTRHISRLNLRHKQPDTITGVMNKIYEYLCETMKTEGSRCLKNLANEPCVWLNACDSLVHPRQVVVSLSACDELPPYLYSLPCELRKYIDVLTHIGVEIEPDHRHYMLVLKMIKEDLGTNDLESDVNKMAAATCAIRRSLFFLSENNPENCDHPLYLLSQKNTLEISTDLYCVDKPGWERRLQNANLPYHLLLIPDDPFDGRNFFKHLRKIPKALRPKDLSEVLVEVIDENSMQPMDLLDNNTSNWFQDRIANDEFQAGLTQLLTSDALEQDYGDRYEEYWRQLENNMRKIQFIVVKRVATILKEREGGIIQGTDNDAQSVLVKTSGAGCMVYVAKDRIGQGHSSTRDIREYTKLLKSIIKESFPTLRPDTLDIIKDLFNTPYNEIQALLDDNGIRASSRIRSKMGPILGDYLPLNKHCLLAPDFLQFFSGEYIAFELDDPLNAGLEGQATYIYAKVVKALGPKEGTEDQVIRMYEIDTGNGKITTSSSSMYKLSCHALVTADGAPKDQEYDLEKVKCQVAADVDYAFYKLPIEDRNRVLKRLIVKWQPGKHPGHEGTANEVLKFLDNKIAQIETDSNRSETNSSGSGGTIWYGVEHISRYACSRAQEQSRDIQQQRQWLDSNSSARAGLSDPTDYSYFRGWARNPQPGEAKRWYRQAEMDLKASKHDHDGSSRAYEWALYKCHQAAEKALRSAYFMKDVPHFKHHNLPDIAELHGDETLKGLADEIAQELGDGMKLRYPDRLSFPRIPHDLYGEETCSRIYGLTERLVQRVGHFVMGV
ncbi:sacsin-like [Lineus longissimus]|uniref:sacsin-like n=1 Tax=Lineus longissimus TaxID=88925 RepID=UPI00315D56F3